MKEWKAKASFLTSYTTACNQWKCRQRAAYRCLSHL